ncbi:unnamed protein product [Penicillium nalgiovense]|uniref:Uncharacterized protein n=1 Tax=Penicillium nalgiovense TaxID=60175 RepID=A0A9W4IU92_PENNA|nr:unnamed protein product [Penicillium nalgiovense]CAG7949551.1 unnamed protein product [Penicillium nalgiovense]CAG7966683.1 unnamed protein product [Penicillium nalgiovense]CAG7985289.1 unnamed protein product [Penicillium nalgiovense]CAG8000445.1 unnamed protein product [Penicillium nalgiovense]
MRILTSTFIALTPWFRETTIMKREALGEIRLLGEAIRHHLCLQRLRAMSVFMSRKRRVELFAICLLGLAESFCFICFMRSLCPLWRRP